MKLVRLMTVTAAATLVACSASSQVPASAPSASVTSVTEVTAADVSASAARAPLVGKATRSTPSRELREMPLSAKDSLLAPKDEPTVKDAPRKSAQLGDWK